MRARHQLQARRGKRPIDIGRPEPEESLPNSSVMLAVTIPASIEDISAVLRTAILLGRSFNTSVSLDLPGEKAVQVEAGDKFSQESLDGLLNSMNGRLRKMPHGEPAGFVLEANITAASFLSPGAISVRVRSSESVPKRTVAAR